jgi:hypothetical protein
MHWAKSPAAINAKTSRRARERIGRDAKELLQRNRQLWTTQRKFVI